jgi:hypothetical protein
MPEEDAREAAVPRGVQKHDAGGAGQRVLTLFPPLERFRRSDAAETEVTAYEHR